MVKRMAEAKAGVSFAGLYERHAREVYRFALGLTGNVAEAEDLTAEAFLRVWECRAEAQWLTVRAYLMAIVRNLRRTAWRHERRRMQMPQQVAAPAADPTAAVELERVLKALDELPAAEREVLLLRAEGGLNYEEIAEITGGTAEAARVRAHRARKRLTEALCQKTNGKK